MVSFYACGNVLHSPSVYRRFSLLARFVVRNQNLKAGSRSCDITYVRTWQTVALRCRRQGSFSGKIAGCSPGSKIGSEWCSTLCVRQRHPRVADSLRSRNAVRSDAWRRVCRSHQTWGAITRSERRSISTGIFRLLASMALRDCYVWRRARREALTGRTVHLGRTRRQGLRRRVLEPRILVVTAVSVVLAALRHGRSPGPMAPRRRVRTAPHSLRRSRR